jgi:hypothetical protein
LASVRLHQHQPDGSGMLSVWKQEAVFDAVSVCECWCAPSFRRSTQKYSFTCTPAIVKQENWADVHGKGKKVIFQLQCSGYDSLKRISF